MRALFPKTGQRQFSEQASRTTKQYMFAAAMMFLVILALLSVAATPYMSSFKEGKELTRVTSASLISTTPCGNYGTSPDCISTHVFGLERQGGVLAIELDFNMSSGLYTGRLQLLETSHIPGYCTFVSDNYLHQPSGDNSHKLGCNKGFNDADGVVSIGPLLNDGSAHTVCGVQLFPNTSLKPHFMCVTSDPNNPWFEDN